MTRFISWLENKLKSGARYAAVAVIAAFVAIGTITFADTPPNVKVQEHFAPNLFDAQSCDPEQNADGGCSWDIGTIGSRSDILGREVTQVGIVKGFSIRWENNVADSDPDLGCALVVLNPNGWFENLNIMDGRMEIYDVDVTRLLKTNNQDRGWLYKLALQAAEEQAADYGCPNKSFADINRWGSDIPSPPCGVEGFGSCDNFTDQPTDQDNTADQTANPGDQGNNGGNQNGCNDPETVNGCERRASINVGDFNIAPFKKGEAVDGSVVNIGGHLNSDGSKILGGTNYTHCHFVKAPGNGLVKDGVVNYWKTEGKTDGNC